ncbi:hypothetical protein GF412_01865 [Candidatus Micrarchaeota archaeon]|nr:hypothetical protein [Candidatus Micrarchaeota archaeon]MBD3417708.1 hypothetical protein [Candidatus Micrarchaeota archaeon]
MGRYSLFLGLLVFLCAFSSATQVVVNSLDYKDVASAAFYANVVGDDLYYVYPSTNLQDAVLQVGPKSLILIESETQPVHASYQSALQNNGATVTEKLVSSDSFSFNLELAERSGTDSFIIADPAYSYNLVVLFSYAKHSGSYVLFATKKNAGEVSNFISSQASGPVLVYGTVDQEVLDSLSSSGITHEQIENGDKYLDNNELVENFFANYDANKQIVFADGTFFEPSVTEGEFPIFLISNTIPTSTYDLIYSLVNSGEVSSSILVKPDYTSAAYDLMKRINENFEEKRFSVFVKMGQAASSKPGEVQPLSSYPLPAVVLDVGLSKIQYNTAKGEVEIILENKGSIATYVTSSLNVYSDGELIGSVGDSEAQLLARDETKGFSYPLNVENPGTLTGNLTTYFSSSKYNYEKALNAYVDMGVVSFVDDSSLEVLTATYSPDADAVSVKYSNSGEEPVYLRTSVLYSSDVSSSTVDDTEVRTLDPGQSTVVRVAGLLVTEDELPTIEMHVLTEYGGREGFLDNSMETPVEILEPEGIDPMLLLGLLLLVVVLIVVYFLMRKKGDKEEKTKAKKN